MPWHFENPSGCFFVSLQALKVCTAGGWKLNTSVTAVSVKHQLQLRCSQSCLILISGNSLTFLRVFVEKSLDRHNTSKDVFFWITLRSWWRINPTPLNIPLYHSWPVLSAVTWGVCLIIFLSTSEELLTFFSYCPVHPELSLYNSSSLFV